MQIAEMALPNERPGKYLTALTCGFSKVDFVGFTSDWRQERNYMTEDIKDLPTHLQNELTFWRNNFDLLGNLTRYAVYSGLFGSYAHRRYKAVADIGSGPSPYVNWMFAENMVAVDPLVEFFPEIPQWSRFWRMNDIKACRDIHDLPDSYLDCALMLNLLDHIEPGARNDYFDALNRKLLPGCVILMFVHIRAKMDQFHFPTTVKEMTALANQRFVEVRSGTVGQLKPWWSEISWWGIYEKKG